jgi:hypothetical protein
MKRDWYSFKAVFWGGTDKNVCATLSLRVEAGHSLATTNTSPPR